MNLINISRLLPGDTWLEPGMPGEPDRELIVLDVWAGRAYGVVWVELWWRVAKEGETPGTVEPDDDRPQPIVMRVVALSPSALVYVKQDALIAG